MRDPIGLELFKVLKKSKQQLMETIVEKLHFVGLQCVEKMKVSTLASRDGIMYKPWEQNSGALASSMGYVVMVDGKSASVSAMSAEGTSYATQVAEENPIEIGLILVAGMNYATFLLHGTKHIEGNYDVLVSASLHAEDLLRKQGLME